MSDPHLLKWRHYTSEMILCAVRWYLRHALSYRDVGALMQERGVTVDHKTPSKQFLQHKSLAGRLSRKTPGAGPLQLAVPKRAMP
jgi:transposase-like protein